MVERSLIHADNGAGWLLGLRRTVDPQSRDPELRPVALIPGYGMNTFILGYHPTGHSMEEHLAASGFEVWAAALRGMDGSVSTGGSRDHGIRDVAITDLPAVVATILSRTGQRADRVDFVGCSLGGTFIFAHLALVPDHRVGSVVAMGAPLRWVETDPLLRFVFSSRWLARNLRLRGTRYIARVALPLLKRFPSLLSIYLHPELADLEESGELTKVVEDPNPVLNEEIAAWLQQGDLLVDGVNITERLREVTTPLLVLTGNADGIVPLSTARFVHEWISAPQSDFVVVGDEQKRYAHADLYLSRDAQALVFSPIAAWLAGCAKR
jgi:pimeloyl-ACP methyl ester carboxylesterase